MAPSLGFPSDKYTAHLGEIQNKGLEVNLNAVIIRDMEKEFEWSVMLQVANNKNKIGKISTALKTVNDENNTRIFKCPGPGSGLRRRGIYEFN